MYDLNSLEHIYSDPKPPSDSSTAVVPTNSSIPPPTVSVTLSIIQLSWPFFIQLQTHLYIAFTRHFQCQKTIVHLYIVNKTPFCDIRCPWVQDNKDSDNKGIEKTSSRRLNAHDHRCHHQSKIKRTKNRSKKTMKYPYTPSLTTTIQLLITILAQTKIINSVIKWQRNVDAPPTAFDKVMNKQNTLPLSN